MHATVALAMLETRRLSLGARWIAYYPFSAPRTDRRRCAL